MKLGVFGLSKGIRIRISMKIFEMDLEGEIYKVNDFYGLDEDYLL